MEDQVSPLDMGFRLTEIAVEIFAVRDIAEFSQFYTDAIDKNEPNSLGWGFYESGDKIILIERYLNGRSW